jgi:uncharacterized repeat protein (TIGR03803 family)
MKSLRLRSLAVASLIAMVTSSAPAQTFKVVHIFGKGTDGQTPYAGLIQDSNGTRYGTTFGGGTGKYDPGTLYTLSSTGKESVIYNFCRKTNCADGSSPQGGVIQDPAGNFYGTTRFGGAYGDGTIYKITPSGQETVLHSFAGGNDGQGPVGSLIEDSKGNFYGTTLLGGGAADVGTVFKLDSSGKTSVLHGFTNGNDGGTPLAGLVKDSRDNLYGTASTGGAFGKGAIFEISSVGKLTTLYSFTGGADGASPSASLILDSAGNLYSTAFSGGNDAGDGTLFEWIKSTGKLDVLYTFCSQPGCSDGENPSEAVVKDSQGRFYGTTFAGGGSSNDGIVWEFADGKLTVLHSFVGTDGSYPSGGSLLLDSDGTLYGTTPDGGNLSLCYNQGCGVIFKLTP